MGEIKILGVSGSPLRRSNTAIMVQGALAGAATVEGVETDFIDLSHLKIEHCKGCRSCRKKKVPYCPTIKDDMGSLYPKLIEADGIILGTPVYFATVNSLMKAFMDRTTCLGGDVGFKMKYKVGSAVTVGATRHGGQEYTLQVFHNYFTLMGAILVTGFPPHGYWGAAGLAGPAGEIEHDSWVIKEKNVTSIQVSRGVGYRVAVVAKMLQVGKQHLGEELLSFENMEI